MAELGFELKQNAELEVLTEEVTKSSEIEGEVLDAASVRSSIARRLQIPDNRPRSADRATEGVVEMMLDATQNYRQPLTVERLFGWQAGLFPTGYSGMHPVITGAWRDDAKGPMQVVSGAMGRERVHYEAPPASRLPEEMDQFLSWFNNEQETKGLLRVAQAHLWFVTIHPFDDGNGRIARAVADQALAQSEDSKQRFYSMSAQIRAERNDYYDVLERTQKGTLDVTEWMTWFLGCFVRSIDGAAETLKQVLAKAVFWQSHAGKMFTGRQTRVLNRFLDGFEGKLTAKKWAAIGKCSVPTAQRDINDLIEQHVLARDPGGSKNTSYTLIGHADGN